MPSSTPILIRNLCTLAGELTAPPPPPSSTQSEGTHSWLEKRQLALVDSLEEKASHSSSPVRHYQWNALKDKVKSYQCISSTPEDIQQTYARTCFALLAEIHLAELEETKAQETPSPPSEPISPLFGARDLKAIQSLLYASMVWGLAPLLEPGVGVPFALRLFRLAPVFPSPPHPNSNDMTKSESYKQIQQKILAFYAMKCGEILLQCRHSIVSCLLRKSYIVDIYAALLILAFSPTLSSKSSSSLSTGTNFSGADSIKMFRREEARNTLHSLMEELDLPTSMVAFMTLVSSPSNPKPPSWIKKVGGRYLSAIILQPGGVKTFLHITMKASGAGSLDSQQLSKIADLLLAKPSHMSVKEYVEVMANQLVQFFHLSLSVPGAAANAIMTPVAYVMVKFINQWPKSSKSCLFDPLFNSLKRMRDTLLGQRPEVASAYHSTMDIHGNRILVNEDVLTSVISSALLLLQDTEPSATLCNWLGENLDILYTIYIFCQKSKSFLLGPVKKLLEILLNGSDEAMLMSHMMTALNGYPQATGRCAPSPNGGVMWIEETAAVPLTPIDPVNLVTSLKDLNAPFTLPTKLFLSLLDVHPVSSADDDASAPISPRHLLLRVQLMLALMDAYGTDMLAELRHKLAFTKMLLEYEDDNDIVLAGLQYLESLLHENDTGKPSTISTQEAEELHGLLNLLDSIKVRAPDVFASQVNAVRISVLSATMSSASIDEDETKQTIQEAIRELGDTEIPLRAHAMGTLRKYILARHPSIVDYLDEVTHLFLDQLEHDDSFVYLNAIKGLSALTDAYAELCIPRIATRYASAVAGDSVLYSLDYRLRVGEVLLLTIQRSGEVFPKISEMVIPQVLVVLEDVSDENRASSFSLLGSIIEHSPMCVIPFLYRLMQHAQGVLTFGKTVGERRGCVFMVVCLLRSMGRNLLDHLSIDALKSLHTKLVYVKSRDEDDLVRAHAQAALDSMQQFVELKVTLIQEL